MNISELKNKPNLFRLYSILMMLSDGEKVETSYTELSELSGFDRRTVKLYMAQLKELEYINETMCENAYNVHTYVLKTAQQNISITNSSKPNYEGFEKQFIGNDVHNIVHTKEDPSFSLSPTPPITLTTEENIYDNKYLSINNKVNLSTDARTREDGPIHKWITQLKTERYWQELVCMKHKILPADIIKFLDDYERDILIRGKRMLSISDIKQYFDYWLPQAIKQRKEDGRNGFIRLIEEKQRLEQQLAQEDEKQRRVR